MSAPVSTSRIARRPVVIPSGVQVKLNDRQLVAKGPKGECTIALHEFVDILMESNEIKVNAKSDCLITGSDSKLYRSIAGTERANIHNLLLGVSQGFEKKLSLVGVGYRAQMKGKMLSLNLGYSHPTDFEIPAGIHIETPSQTEIIVKGICKQLVGEVASKIRAMRPPEPYKGKGVRYANENVVIKETKKK
ncbi:MAG TPA: 50S ribosomal protein L6 [Gammaproteobacteria bacterium]|jgi:large subunit ribosomal protein L6|nr:50S ribosomal protein L6 [Gammaproteobacteria bacterium]